ncbi:MAG: hypothetical protein GXO55_04920, partial [Chloroflexi bacterium]|nr:hypothetical protein [Chloroflexota bacterium]
SVAMLGSELVYEYEDVEVRPGERYEYKLQTRDGTFYGPWEVQTPSAGRLFLPMIQR